MSYEKQERELRLKDMIFGVQRRWRSILVLALVFAVALGAVKVLDIRNKNAKTVDRTAYLESLAAYQADYATKQREVQWLTAHVESQRTYMAESIMMSLDPTNVCRAGFDLKVIGADEETTRRVLDRYRSSLNDSAFLAAAAEELGIESKYLRELLTATTKESTVGEMTQQYINVTIDYSDLEGAERLLELALAQVENSEAQIAQELGDHEPEAIANHAALQVDNAGLASRQWAEKERLSYYENALNVSKNAFSALTAPVDPASAAADPVRGGVKFAIIGALLGGVLGCGWAVLAVLFGDKLYSVTDLQGRYAVKVLGVVAGSGKRCIVDKWLDRLEGRVRMDTESNDALLSAVLRGCGEGTVLLCGSQEETARLSKRIGAVAASAPLAQMPKELEGCESVAIVAVCGQDRYSELSKQMELVRNLGKTLCGCIVVEY